MSLGAVHICSFHDATYRAFSRGKVIIFDWSDRFGPLLVNAEGETLSRQWPWPQGFGQLINNWYRQGKRVCRNCGFCLWRPPDQDIAIPIVGRHYRATKYVVFQQDRCGCPNPEEPSK